MSRFVITISPEAAGADDATSAQTTVRVDTSTGQTRITELTVRAADGGGLAPSDLPAVDLDMLIRALGASSTIRALPATETHDGPAEEDHIGAHEGVVHFAEPADEAASTTAGTTEIEPETDAPFVEPSEVAAGLAAEVGAEVAAPPRRGTAAKRAAVRKAPGRTASGRSTSGHAAAKRGAAGSASAKKTSGRKAAGGAKAVAKSAPAKSIRAEETPAKTARKKATRGKATRAKTAAPAKTASKKATRAKTETPAKTAAAKATSRGRRAAGGAEPRAYRRMPDPTEVLSVYAQVGSITALAEHYGVPRHTANGWARRLRGMGHTIGRS